MVLITNGGNSCESEEPKLERGADGAILGSENTHFSPKIIIVFFFFFFALFPLFPLFAPAPPFLSYTSFFRTCVDWMFCLIFREGGRTRGRVGKL